MIRIEELPFDERHLILFEDRDWRVDWRSSGQALPGGAIPFGVLWFADGEWRLAAFGGYVPESMPGVLQEMLEDSPGVLREFGDWAGLFRWALGRERPESIRRLARVAREHGPEAIRAARAAGVAV